MAISNMRRKSQARQMTRMKEQGIPSCVLVSPSEMCYSIGELETKVMMNLLRRMRKMEKQVSETTTWMIQ